MWYFWAKKLIEIWHLLITEKFFFWPFRKWKYDLFFSQKVDGKMIFTDYWKFLFWTFQRRKIRPFLSQEVDGKMIITWFLWAFHDITGFGKYGFSCSVSYQQTCYSMIKKVSPHRFLFFFLCRAEATSTSFLKLCKFRKYYGKVIFVPTSCVEKGFFCSQKFIASSFPSS